MHQAAGYQGMHQATPTLHQTYVFGNKELKLAVCQYSVFIVIIVYDKQKLIILLVKDHEYLRTW